MINKFTKGNTLIEVVIAIAILVVILVISVPKINDFRDTQSLKNTTVEITTLLNEARTSTLSSKNSTVYGVHFESDRATLFTGNTFDNSDTNNKVIIFDSSVALPSGNINLNGSGSDILFTRLTGDTNMYGTIILELAGDSSTQKTITISKLGSVSVN